MIGVHIYAVMENVFGHLKRGLLFLLTMESTEHAKAELLDYLYYDNYRMIKVRLKGLPPAISQTTNPLGCLILLSSSFLGSVSIGAVSASYFM